MNRYSIRFGATALVLGLLATPAWAEDDSLDDITMEVVEDPDADEREYVDEIRLPDAAAPEGRGNAGVGAGGTDTARDRAREGGREFGQSTAQEARELGRDAGNAAKSGNGTGGGPPDDLPVEVP